jgi:hypothetical protein
MKQNEIITVEAEEIPIEKAVEKSFLTQLEKLEITRSFLEEKKDECLQLQLNGQDKEAYTNIRETRLNMKVRRVAIEKICKKGREDATREQKAWIALEKDWVKIVSEGEMYLEGLEDQYLLEQEKIKQETKRQQEEEFIKRQAELTKMGVVYREGNFVLNDISFEAVLIKESDSDVWETMRSKFYECYIVNEEQRLVEEKKNQETKAEFERQQIEQDRKQKELEAREAEIKRKEQEESDRQKNIELQKQQEESRKEREKINARCNQLQLLGMSFNFQHDAYLFQDINVDNKTEICLFDDAEWDALIIRITPVIEQRKKEIEEKRIADIEEQKGIAAEQAVKKEQQRVAEESRLAELKRQQDEVLRQKEMEMADDKTKWNKWIEAFSHFATIPPTMKSPHYRTKASIAREKIEEIKNL